MIFTHTNNHSKCHSPFMVMFLQRIYGVDCDVWVLARRPGRYNVTILAMAFLPTHVNPPAQRAMSIRPHIWYIRSYVWAVSLRAHGIGMLHYSLALFLFLFVVLSVRRGWHTPPNRVLKKMYLHVAGVGWGTLSVSQRTAAFLTSLLLS